MPDYLLWLVAGAVSGTVVVGINSTYRGEQLAQLIDHTDCQALVTSGDLLALLDGVDTSVPADRVLVVDTPEYDEALDAAPSFAEATPAPNDEDLYLLIFTSGSTGLPKAVRCTQGRIGRTGMHVAGIAELTEADVVYAPLPFFHSASLFTGWASAVNAGVPIVMRRRFSASGTLPDIRRLRRHVPHLHRQGPQLHPERARAARRRRHHAAAGHRQRSVGGRHQGVRSALRLPRAGQRTARPRA